MFTYVRMYVRIPTFLIWSVLGDKGDNDEWPVWAPSIDRFHNNCTTQKASKSEPF